MYSENSRDAGNYMLFMNYMIQEGHVGCGTTE